MEWLLQLVSNKILIGSLSAWVVAQVLKTILYAAINKTFDIKRLFGDGGMPSGHSATVTSMAAISLFLYGPGSFEFAVTTPSDLCMRSISVSTLLSPSMRYWVR